MREAQSFLSNAVGYRLFLNERDSDVSITVRWEGDKWHFPAHRLVLSAMSDVFRTMLAADMVEKSTKRIVINDSNPLTVKHFLRYFYLGIVELNGWSEVVSLFKMAHKYGVYALVNQCESYLVSNIGVSNACILYELAQTYSLRNLRREAQQFILDAGFIISATEGFFNLKTKSLETFVSNPRFNIENEGSLLTSLREWAVCECSRKGLALSNENILSAMEPFLKYISWDFIAESCRTFIPRYLVEKCRPGRSFPRKSFHVMPSLQHHLTILKFVVELGAFFDNNSLYAESLNCLKFTVDNHAFIAGFRIVGMFLLGCIAHCGQHSLTLKKSDNRLNMQFNLDSLPWKQGSVVGEYIWQEMYAYLPYPVRIDPFSSYYFNLKCENHSTYVKWPITRLESGRMNTELGAINFEACGTSYGITQLFMLPAPPYRSICNDTDAY